METPTEEMLHDFKRMLRYHSKSEVPAHLVNYVLDRYTPKISAEEGVKLNIISPEKIMTVVLGHYDISIDKLRTPSRFKNLVHIRHVCMYLLKIRTIMTLKTIGSMFGGRDHTTALHGINAISNLIQTNEEFRKEIEFLNSQI